jgi:hypothetical protein
VKADLKKIVSFLFITTLVISCREEIIEPNNFVGKINEPVQIRENNSYMFLLNAENLSMNMSVSLYFNSSRTRFNVKLIGYESGYTNVVVQDYRNVEKFRYFIAREVIYHTELLDGYVPTTINIRTNEFTGKIQIEFRKTL